MLWWQLCQKVYHELNTGLYKESLINKVIKAYDQCLTFWIPQIPKRVIDNDRTLGQAADPNSAAYYFH
jgi:hypothetical protein